VSTAGLWQKVAKRCACLYLALAVEVQACA
jgi:hypothetical protein